MIRNMHDLRWLTNRRILSQALWGLLFYGIVTWNSPAFAQRDRTLREVPDTEIIGLVPIVLPPARVAAVSDAAGLLAIGYRPGTIPQVALVRLDAQGTPVEGPPVGITLPRPDSLAAFPNYAVALTFHPVFPLLYVWQDVGGAKRDDPNDFQRYQDFDHLLIYSVEQPEPKLLVSFARGTGFAYGSERGALVLDAAATRLYVPNVHHDSLTTPKVPVVGVARIYLDTAGLPLLQDEAVPNSATTGTSTPLVKLESAAAAAARAAKLDAIQKARVAGQPVVLRMSNTGPSNTFAALPPCGLGFAPVSDDIVIFGGFVGPHVWDEATRNARLNLFYVDPFMYYSYQLVGHPKFPVIYVTGRANSVIHCIQHVEGRITLLPQQYILEGGGLHSYPVVMPKRNQVAVGGVGKVYLINLTDKGLFKPERTQAAVFNPLVEALAYSEKYDRLYVPTEKKP